MVAKKPKATGERPPPGPLSCLNANCRCVEDVHDVDALTLAVAGYPARNIRTRLCARCRSTLTVTHDRGPATESGSVVP
jgi:hypothetical protein